MILFHLRGRPACLPVKAQKVQNTKPASKGFGNLVKTQQDTQFARM
jgi:hypothetical protein